MDRDWNSCALACRWAHSVQNSSGNVAITSVEHKPLPPRFVLYFSYKTEVPATTPPCILLRCLRPIQLSGSISWTPTKTCSRRKSFSLTGESLIPTCGLRTPVCFLLESKSFENAEESSYLRVPFTWLSFFCCNEHHFENNLFFSWVLPFLLEVGRSYWRVLINKFWLCFPGLYKA